MLFYQGFCWTQSCLYVRFGHILYAYVFSIWKYKISTTKIWSQIFLDRFCSSFVFKSRICLVLGFWWHLYKSLYLSLSWCWFLYCTLCRLSTEFSGNSKQGLYFCCKVWTLAVFLEAVETYISDYFHWEQVKKWKYTNLSQNKRPKSNNFPKVCSYLCLSVDRSVYRSSASHLFSNLFVSSKMLFLIEFFSRGFVGHSLGPCITCLHVHMLQSRVWFILNIISVMAGISSRLMLHNIIICTALFENLKLHL